MSFWALRRASRASFETSAALPLRAQRRNRPINLAIASNIYGLPFLVTVSTTVTVVG
jgi:hypothetical protein